MRLKDLVREGLFYSPDDPPAGDPAPPAEPPAPAPDIERMVAERVAEEVERRMGAPRPAPQPAVPSLAPDSRTPVERAQAEAEQGGIFNPEWVTNRAIEIATRDAESRIMGSLAPHIARLSQKDAVNDLSSGLGSAGREYLQRLAPGIDPSTLTPETRDLLVRAARDYEREKTPTRVNVDPAPTHSEPAETITAEERQQAAQYRSMGVELTDADIIAARSQSGLPQDLAGVF